MGRPIIAFLTDFGTRDHYVGAMKGAALTVCPDATLVDITHDIDPQDVLGGALELAAACPYFPAGTIFVAVVDPGVGSGRRGLAAQSADHLFVGPDNGLLTLALRRGHARVVELADHRYARPVVSRTFEGRDRFAPAAAWLATGVALEALGPPVADPVALDIPVAAERGGAVHGVVLRVDRFGNMVTNIDRQALEAFDADPLHVTAAGRPVGPVIRTYAEARPGEVCALVGSTDRLEIAVNGGSAAERLSGARGTPVTVTRA